jgi:hypothetical protein
LFSSFTGPPEISPADLLSFIILEYYRLVLGVLAVWRVTHLLQAEDGPWDIVVRIRRAVGNGFVGRLLDCFHCLSLWVSLPAAAILGREWTEGVFLWLALSAGAILLEQITRRENVGAPAMYLEEKENNHVLLRQSKETVSDDESRPPTQGGGAQG